MTSTPDTLEKQDFRDEKSRARVTRVKGHFPLCTKRGRHRRCLPEETRLRRVARRVRSRSEISNRDFARRFSLSLFSVRSRESNDEKRFPNRSIRTRRCPSRQSTEHSNATPRVIHLLGGSSVRSGNVLMKLSPVRFFTLYAGASYWFLFTLSLACLPVT